MKRFRVATEANQAVESRFWARRCGFIGAWLCLAAGMSGCRTSTAPQIADRPNSAFGPRSALRPAPLPKMQPKPRLKPRPQAKALPTATPKPPKPIAVSSKTAGEIDAIITKQKVFALTFDDGPDPAYTPQVLRILHENRVPATFFMVGSMVRAHPAVAQQVMQMGECIGNHSWSHPRTPKFPIAEVQRTDAILKSTLGIVTRLFRPPYGLMQNGMVAQAQREGQRVIVWSTLGADWDKHATASSIAAKVLRRAKPGGIALLHDGGGNRSQTIAALPHIIAVLRKKGFRFVTVPQLLEMGPPIPISTSQKHR